jgi:DNA processing protein
MAYSEQLYQALRTAFDTETADYSLQWSKHAAHHILVPTHPAYPTLLKEISNPPKFLFVQGNVDLLNRAQIAIVGGRYPTEQGASTAYAFAQELAAHGYVITSGLALGIDGASHRGALQGGKTIAVLGSGIQQMYPKQHTDLAAQIAQCGALVSEYPLQTKPKAYHFPQRNRIISGLSLGVLVAEAKLKSGSLITANLALEQGREVFAIPGSIHNTLAKGCHHLLRQGACLVEKTTDILNELPPLAATKSVADNTGFETK